MHERTGVDSPASGVVAVDYALASVKGMQTVGSPVVRRHPQGGQRLHLGTMAAATACSQQVGLSCVASCLASVVCWSSLQASCRTLSVSLMREMRSLMRTATGKEALQKGKCAPGPSGRQAKLLFGGGGLGLGGCGA